LVTGSRRSEFRTQNLATGDRLFDFHIELTRQNVLQKCLARTVTNRARGDLARFIDNVLSRNTRDLVFAGRDVILAEDDPNERLRLGRLGFQPFFTCLMNAEFPGGILNQGLMEIYRETWVRFAPRRGVYLLSQRPRTHAGP
jgi:hypothetical protein